MGYTQLNRPKAEAFFRAVVPIIACLSIAGYVLDGYGFYPPTLYRSTSTVKVTSFGASSTSHRTPLPYRYLKAIQPLVNCTNPYEKLRVLVHIGQSAFNKTKNLHSSKYFVNNLHSYGGEAPLCYERVLGCTSTVLVAAKLLSVTASPSPLVLLDAKADSLVAKGLVGLVLEAFHEQSAESVLAYAPDDMMAASSLLHALTPSRVNGLRNIILTIQQTVKHLMGIQSESCRQNLYNGITHNISSHLETCVGETAKGSRIDLKTMQNLPNIPTKEDAAVLLSGGVDSSVALYKLHQEGRKVKAYYLKVWLGDELAYLGNCPWEEDIRYATEVCKGLNVPLEVVPLQQAYWEVIVNYVLSEARKGKTPNSDILCNSCIKFGKFWDMISGTHPYIASGHYARIAKDDTPVPSGVKHPNPSTVVQLVESADPLKDQTYFLSRLNQKQLSKAIFPVGDSTKQQVRSLAAAYNLPTKERKDSQGICFLGSLKFSDFLRHFLGETEGPIVNMDSGEVVGTHKGLWFHTIGQRRGIGDLLSVTETSNGPWYTVGKNVASNTLYISNQYNYDKWFTTRTCFWIEDIHWIAGIPPKDALSTTSTFYTPLKAPSTINKKLLQHRMGVLKKPTFSLTHTAKFTSASLQPTVSIDVKIRHGSDKIPSSMQLLHADGKEAIIKLSRKDIGLAPGQFVALYRGWTCLGSGIIADTIVHNAPSDAYG